MISSALFFLLFSLLSLFEGAIAQGNNRNGGNNDNNNGGGNNNNNGAAQIVLDPALIQTASESDGTPKDGQAKSLTNKKNFSDFCRGKTLMNGKQLTGGSCNGIVMGDIPSKNNMIAAMIVGPAFGDTVEPNKPFDISVQVQNLVAGTFTNPDNTYYAAPQQLQGGKVVGHCHVVVQKMNSFNDKQPPSAATFAFFKGINDAGNGQGLLKATVTTGLPAGIYRICTMVGAANHQPPLMPVAQRGAQDDCIRMEVKAGGNAGNANNKGGNANNANTGKAATPNTGNTGNATTGNAGNTGNKGNASSSSANNGGNRGGRPTQAGDTTPTTTAAAGTATTSAGTGNGQNGRNRQPNTQPSSSANSGGRNNQPNPGINANPAQTNKGDATQAQPTKTAAMMMSGESGRPGRGQGQRFARRRRLVLDEAAPFQARELIV